MKNIKCCCEDMACKHAIQLCIRIMQSKTQMLIYKAKCKGSCTDCVQMQEWKLACGKKKKNVSTRNLHSSIFIFVSPSLQTLTGGIYTSQKSRETKEMLPIFQLKKGQPGATLYSKVISWVKLSCAS